ncbi:hypothetical protein EW146_g7308 [Bondarzewia mesenterica]|uniref:Rgp1-domain-containing protein n=1 Tax=Bondarzewia mesenterica TaxID=1095465 RepID=A0A4S4LL99_9AGAM|nr:hypothetical protein EW146_g7308 [Bondarzewia mesenterica]
MSATTGSTQSDVDTALRVVVSPSQSSYFAGEPFSVIVTITNTRSTGSTPPAQAHTHKRSAHSVSSAPLARPPTSPGLLRSASTAAPRSSTSKDVLVRKGLIGTAKEPKGADDLPEVEKDGVRRVMSKSLSVDILPQSLDERTQETKGKLLGVGTRPDDRWLNPTSPRISSPLARSPSLPTNHPHARKPSVLDAQIHTTSNGDSHSLANPPIPQSASVSSFSVSLDTITETSHSCAPPTPNAISTTPNFLSPTPPISFAPSTTNQNLASQSHSYPPRAPASSNGLYHPPQHGLGHGPPPISSNLSIPPTSNRLNNPPPTAPASRTTFSPPNTELVLYAYVQLIGTATIAPPPSATHAPALTALRQRILRHGPLGGGSMDITSSLQGRDSSLQQPFPGRSRRHSRSASLSASLFSFLSPAFSSSPGAPPSASAFKPGHRGRAPSYAPGAQSGGVGSVGLGLGVPQEEEWDPETPVPVFEVPPAMLAVDLSLGPGESRSYTYSVRLPAHLPPTYKGRSVRFSYQLSVGTCRAGAAAGQGPATPSGANSNSRVMKVPIMVYNNVSVDKPQVPYDILRFAAPLVRRPQAKVTENVGRQLSVKGKGLFPNSASLPAHTNGTLDDLRQYALRLLQSTEQLQNGNSHTRIPTLGDENEREGEGMLKGCREAVEILTRVFKKVSYDVNKDGVKVAVLTFTKAAYRLGETVLGVVELNDKAGRARVLKLSAMLETHETLPAGLSTSSDARHLRRVHAEYHSSYVSNSLRTTFCLDIPSDASPAFQISLGELPTGGVEWKVRLCLLVAVASPDARQGLEGARVKQLVRDGPRGEWGSSWPRSRLRPRPDRPPRPRRILGRHFFASTFLTPSEGAFHDGDEDTDGEDDASLGEGEVDLGAGEEGWREVVVETVECEVPVKVWPGNTAFRAMDVVFDV